MIGIAKMSALRDRWTQIGIAKKKCAKIRGSMH